MKKILVIVIVIVLLCAWMGYVYHLHSSTTDQMQTVSDMSVSTDPVSDESVTISDPPPTEKTRENSQWRGKNRDGVYSETGLLKVWPADGPELLWKYEGLDEGFTSVAIANRKIYVTGQTDDNIMLYVLNLKGELLNKKVVGQEWSTNYTGTRCTVAVNDGKLYIFNSLGQLRCLNETTLNEIWKKDALGDFDGKNIMYGMTESPLIVGDKIFITPGGAQHNMVALNKNTGALIWSSPGLGTPSAYCSPLYIGNHSVPIVVTCMMQDIIAFNADTGEMLWSHQRINDFNVHPNIPIYSDGMIFSVTGYGVGARLLRLTDGGKSVELVWKNEEMDNLLGSAIRMGDYIYGSGHYNKYFFCVDWKTGLTKYKVREIGECNIISADGMLYCYSEKGSMNLVKPNPNRFELISSFKVPYGTGEHWAHPVIHEGVLYLRHGDALMAYKIK